MTTPSSLPSAAQPTTGDVTGDITGDVTGARALAVSFVADVVAVHPGTPPVVRAGSQLFSAQIAFSCLVAPELGDRVACWRSSSDDGSADQVFVLAVLQRRNQKLPQRLVLASHSEVQATKLSVKADEIELNASKVGLVYQTLHSVGELWKATVGQLRLVGSSFSTVFDQQTHHAQQHQRTVSGLDRVQAQILEQRAEEVMHLQANTMLANGERLVKVRGTQIHFG